MKNIGMILPLIISVSSLLFAIVLCIVWYVKPRTAKNRNDVSVMRNTGKKLLIFSLFFFISVWGIRYAAGYYSFFYPNDYVEAMHPVEQIGNSFLHALQTFSMDEGYTEYALCGKEMMEQLFGGFSFGEGAVLAYRIYTAVLNTAAPVVGGAFIFEILAGIIPQIAFALSKLAIWKETYYFSELTEQSLALAKNIRMSAKRQGSTIVFTDAYIDDENETSSEMLLTAKAIGAICLKDDIAHISLRRAFNRKIHIFLASHKEDDNVSALAAILSHSKRKHFRNTELYVFSSEDNYSFLEDEVIYLTNRFIASLHDEQNNSEKWKKTVEKFDKKSKKLEKRFAKLGKEVPDSESKKLKGKLLKKEGKDFPIPRVVPVNGVRNMALNLFCDLPLFEGLCGKQPEDGAVTLNLTIFGIGAIGMESFLAANWFGQMLDTRLCVNVVSLESEEEFCRQVNRINPDIIKSCTKNDSILRYGSGDNDFSEPYCELKYFSADVKNTDLDTLLDYTNDSGYSLRDSDYIIVALGSDSDNFNLADKFRQRIGYYHLNEANDKKTIISYVIYNSELCRSLNTKNRHDNVQNARDGREFDIYMHAFGCMEDIYCVDNLFFEKIGHSAAGIGDRYQKTYKKREHHAQDSETWRKMSTDYYNYRANIARRLHLDYKAYSAGVLKPSLFYTASDEELSANIISGREAYRSFVGSHEKNEDEIRLMHRLAWLEHRRWTAFMRMNGFVCPDDFEKYYAIDNDIHPVHNHKFTMLKLHPCLVEADDLGIRSATDDMGKPADAADLSDPSGLDHLDDLSARLAVLNGVKLSAVKEFKYWDYPFMEEFD